MNASAAHHPPALPLAYAVRGLHAELDGRSVLHDLHLAMAAGRWTAVVGPNGAGKSTLLKCMAGLIPCTGERELLGQPLLAYAHRERARRLVWLGQSETAADDLVVRDVVMLGRLPHQPWLATASDADQRAVEQALADVGMTWAVHKPLGHLSGGERQRVLLARALATQGQVLLMDEPLSHLDPPHQADWLALVRGLVGRGCTVVSVLHELNMALHADELLVLREGRIAHHGASGDVATHEALQAAFDHRVKVHQVAGQWVVLPV